MPVIRVRVRIKALDLPTIYHSPCQAFDHLPGTWWSRNQTATYERRSATADLPKKLAWPASGHEARCVSIWNGSVQIWHNSAVKPLVVSESLSNPPARTTVGDSTTQSTMFFAIAIALSLKKYGNQAVALPLFSPTSSTVDVPAYASNDPSSGCQGRAVLDILWSCLATTFACTWVSVHPNVPWRNEGKWTILGRRIYLMLLAILVPELMIVWAYRQWRGAVVISEAVNEARPNSGTHQATF